jgi:hypothetical protein
MTTTSRRPLGEPKRRSTGPFALVGAVVLALIGFALFFVGFLLAPLAILLAFCLIFAARDRSSRKPARPTVRDGSRPPPPDPLAVEARIRQQILARKPRPGAELRERPPGDDPAAPDGS